MIPGTQLTKACVQEQARPSCLVAMGHKYDGEDDAVDDGPVDYNKLIDNDVGGECGWRLADVSMSMEWISWALIGKGAGLGHCYRRQGVTPT